jgi:hexulose-6-phosphate isomerase
MSLSSRRLFLRTTSLALGAAALGGPAAASRGASPSNGAAPSWKLAYMLGAAGPIRERLDQVKAAGFEGVELLSPNQIDTAELLSARDAAGLAIHGVSGSRHWSDPLSDPNPEVVAKGIEAIRQSIKDCKAYGGTTVLVVPAVVTKKVSYQDAWDRSTAALRQVVPQAEEAGITLAIEEVWNRFLLSAPEMARYVDQFQSPAVKAYFDVGNVVEYGYPQEWIRTLGPRIAKIHVKEYAKKNRFDYALGKGGEIDWAEVRQALLDIKYDGWITAEVPWTGPERMKSEVVEPLHQLLGIA